MHTPGFFEAIRASLGADLGTRKRFGGLFRENRMEAIYDDRREDFGTEISSGPKCTLKCVNKKMQD
jgi:hypothetical protein